MVCVCGGGGGGGVKKTQTKKILQQTRNTSGSKMAGMTIKRSNMVFVSIKVRRTIMLLSF